jgi:hypothetical protein
MFLEPMNMSAWTFQQQLQHAQPGGCSELCALLVLTSLAFSATVWQAHADQPARSLAELCWH